jgi:hypothetical protein
MSSIAGVVYGGCCALGTRIGATVRGSAVADRRRPRIYLSRPPVDNSCNISVASPLADLFPAYRKWQLRQDPVCDAYRATPKCSTWPSSWCGHPNSLPGFRRQIFDEPGIAERISTNERGDDARVINGVHVRWLPPTGIGADRTWHRALRR